MTMSIIMRGGTHKHKWIIFLISVVVIAVAWVFVFAHRGQVKLVVIAIPEDSTVTLNGVKINDGNIYVRPGEYTLAATRQYFNRVETIINTKDYKNGENIYLLPKAVSDEAISWLNDNPDVQLQRESAGGEIAEKTNKLITDRYSILTKLPYVSNSYRIDYSFNGRSKPELIISLYATSDGDPDPQAYNRALIKSKHEALDFLSAQGVDKSKYNITFSPEVSE